MQFRTEINIEKSTFQFSNQSKVLTIGSCFSDVIGNYLIEKKMDCLSNPFGTVFNPISMINLVEMAFLGKKINEDLMVERDGLWFHYDFHSQFFAQSKDELITILNDKIKEVGAFLEKTDFLVLTFGTAIIYELKENATLVSNCHKIPALHFEKRLLNVDEIYFKIKLFLGDLKKFCPKIDIIISISPVRHLKETLVLNSVSKSILRNVSHLLSNDYIEYFPAFEIMNDDLRDYRFYKDDLLHPTLFAEKYIINKFQNAYFDDGLNQQISDWQKIKLSMNHIIQNEGSTAHKKHLEGILAKLKVFSKMTDVSKEIHEMETKLASI
jgi:GSCFA family